MMVCMQCNQLHQDCLSSCNLHKLLTEFRERTSIILIGLAWIGDNWRYSSAKTGNLGEPSKLEQDIFPIVMISPLLPPLPFPLPPPTNTQGVGLQKVYEVHRHTDPTTSWIFSDLHPHCACDYEKGQCSSRCLNIQFINIPTLAKSRFSFH